LGSSHRVRPHATCSDVIPLRSLTRDGAREVSSDIDTTDGQKVTLVGLLCWTWVPPSVPLIMLRQLVGVPRRQPYRRQA